jgi:hypothetical protein
MLGFEVSETTISRWMRRAPKSPQPTKHWLAFLRNHREAIAAMDFFTVPTLTFNVLYCFFIISHDRRRILHFNVSRHPTSSWIVQQLREAFPYDAVPRFLVFDPRREVRVRSAQRYSLAEDHTCAHLDWKPMAEWSG